MSRTDKKLVESTGEKRAKHISLFSFLLLTRLEWTLDQLERRETKEIFSHWVSVDVRIPQRSFFFRSFCLFLAEKNSHIVFSLLTSASSLSARNCSSFYTRKKRKRVEICTIMCHTHEYYSKVNEFSFFKFLMFFSFFLAAAVHSSNRGCANSTTVRGTGGGGGAAHHCGASSDDGESHRILRRTAQLVEPVSWCWWSSTTTTTITPMMEPPPPPPPREEKKNFFLKK